MLAECEFLGLSEPEALLDAANPAAVAHIRTRLCKHVMDGEYRIAEDLLTTLTGLDMSGLPGVLGQDWFSYEGNEVLYDFRSFDHGPGTRILVEIVINWGQ